MQLKISDLSFTHEGSYTPVFEHVNISMDTSWHLGLIARNGRGKTTLLHLLEGRYPYRGKIECPLTPVYFPFTVEDATQLTLFVMQSAAPETQDWQLLRELNQLKVDEDVLDRPFDTLSQGEQTKALRAALFAREDAYPLIDEPTPHLDAHGRALVAVPGDERKIKLANMAVQQAWSVRRLEQVVALGEAASEPKPAKPRLPELGSLESMAREVFGTRVKLEGGLDKGKLVLSYYSQDDLQHIWDVIERMKV